MEIIKYKPNSMQLKTNERGEVVLDIKLNRRISKKRKQLCIYDILQSQEGEEQKNTDSGSDIKDAQIIGQSQVLRKMLRFCMKHQNIDIGEIASAINISKNKIINFLKNRNKNPLKDDDKKELRLFLRKQMVR